jgi:hypothetical protein
MECLQATEILSAAHDGELVDAALLDEARAHRDACAGCRVFERNLQRTAELAAPVAPAELVDRLVALSAEAAAGIRAAAADAAAEAAAAEEASATAGSAPEEPLQPESAGQRWRWPNRLVAYASAAAVLLVVLMTGSVVMLNSLGAQKATKDLAATTTEGALGETMAAPQDAAGAAADAAARAENQTPAPPYVALDGRVWTLVDSASAAPSAPTTAGIVTSSLGANDAPAEHTAFWAGADDSRLYVQSAGSSYLAFKPIVRTLGLAEFQLASGGTILTFGTWPSLPADYAQPTGADGSPTFRRWGFDDRNVDVYTTPMGRAQDGFAVAPGTAADDPAAGNPNWTWWEPLE